jgi:hypothetical protein
MYAASRARRPARARRRRRSRDPALRAAALTERPVATRSLPLASTTRRRHSQTDNEHDPSPIIDVDPGRHAGGEHNGRRRPATTCSGSTSAPGAVDRIRRRRSSSATARHALVGATTRSPCLLHGLLRASPEGSREVRHAPVSVADQNSRPRAPARRPRRASAEDRLRRGSVVRSRRGGRGSKAFAFTASTGSGGFRSATSRAAGGLEEGRVESGFDDVLMLSVGVR